MRGECHDLGKEGRWLTSLHLGDSPHDCEILFDKLDPCLKPQQIILVPMLQLWNRSPRLETPILGETYVFVCTVNY